MPTDAIRETDVSATRGDLRRVRHCPGCGDPLISEPVLTCSKCGHELRLRCFSYRAAGNRYIAECIDLDILGEGDTQEDAIGALQEAMTGYLTAVIDGQDTTGLIPRPSPLSHRVRYYFELLKDRLQAFGDRQHTQSVISCRYEVRDGHLVDCQ